MIGQPVARHKVFLSRLMPLMRPLLSASATWVVSRIHLQTAFLLSLLMVPLMAPTMAQAASRSLTLHNTHTKETQTITFKRNGRYDPEGLRQMNRFLRDWRRNESTQMDPVLFDLIWNVYKETGAKKPIHVVSGYRSPATNNMLRRRSRGVAKNSRHTKGQAMDFYLPGVPISKIRRAGLRLQAGGVGYYPTSRSPFVHIDTGNVRHWPRMTRKQLARVFPDGNTVHVPTDGRPLKGYKKAKVQVAARKAEMIRTTRSARRYSQVAKAAPARPRSPDPVRVASNKPVASQGEGTLLGRLLNRGPKAPPKPTFETVNAPGTATTTEFPTQLASLPKRPDGREETRAPGSLVATRSAQLTVSSNIDADDIIAAAEASDAKLRAAETTNPDEQAAPPILFRSLPRARPADQRSSSFQLASANPEPKPLPIQVASADQTAPDDSAVGSIGTSPVLQQLANAPQVTQTRQAPQPARTEPAADASQVASAAAPDPANVAAHVAAKQPERVELAALPHARAPITASQQDAKSVLNQLTGAAEQSNEASIVRAAYASASTTGLPTAAPRTRLIAQPDNSASDLASLPRKAERQQLASLPSNLKERIGVPRDMMAKLPRRADRAPLQAPAARNVPPRAKRTSDADASHLTKLTFAYGPSGMAHFAHMKQSTRTATFARLSRPIPANLRALVSKPSSIVDQTFSRLPGQMPQDARFSGRAIARLSIRSFR
nr:DUF882 domain-containing protein [Cohaesibacter intestini]